MRLLLLIPFISFGLNAQETAQRTVSISGGHEFHGWHAYGWNITANAVRQFDKIPRLHAGFTLAYGISEFNNSRSGVTEYPSTSADYTTSILYNSHYPSYARMERCRFGVESSYSLIDKKKHQFSVGLGVIVEGLIRYKENGVEVTTEIDSTTNTEIFYTEDYAFDHRTKDIEKPYSLFLVPQLNYTYKINDHFGVFLRSSLYARMQYNIRYGGCLQNNLGINYRW